MGEGRLILSPFYLSFKTKDMATKTYRLIYNNSYATSFNVGGKSIFVRFMGSLNNNGKFTTSNEDLQKEMESAKAYNTIYCLDYDSTEYEKTLLKEKEEDLNKSTEETKVDMLEVSVHNIQEANQLAKEKFGEDAPTFRGTSATAKAVEFFKENGINLTFE